MSPGSGDPRPRDRLAAALPGDDPVRTVAWTLALAAAAVGLTVVSFRLGEAVSPAAARELLERAGPYAPLVFVALQAVQVVLAPVPGQVLSGVGGYLFGGLAGTVYSMAGIVLGSYAVFAVTRRHGRGVAVRLLGEERTDRFEAFGRERGAVTLFALFLLPTFPDDALCAVAGLWDLRTRTFLALLVVGRSPTVLAAAYAGGSLESGALGRLTVALAAVVAVVVVVRSRRGRIEAALSPGDAAPGPDREGNAGGDPGDGGNPDADGDPDAGESEGQ